MARDHEKKKDEKKKGEAGSSLEKETSVSYSARTESGY